MMARRPHVSIGAGADGRVLLAILGVSVLLRVGIAFYLGDVVDAPPLLTDQRSYHALAERLLGGYGYSFDRDWYPFTAAGEPTAHWSFLYSAMVAAVYSVFGVHPLAARLVQAVLGGILLPLAVYGLAQRAFPSDRAVPMAASGCAACYPYFALYAATLMTETVFITLLVHSLDVSLRVGQGIRNGKAVRWATWAYLGAVLGLATLIRQSILPWLPVLALWLGWQARRGAVGPVLRGLGLTGVVVLGMILPWTWRNYRAYGELLLLNSNSGYAMYSAQHPMHGTSFQEYTAAPLPADLPHANEAIMDRALMRRGIAFVVEDPGRYLRLCLSRVRAFLEFWPKPGTTLLNNLGRVGSFVFLAPLAVYGLALSWQRGMMRHEGALLPLFMAFYTVLHVMTWAMVRYRLPVDAVAMPFAALGAVALAGRVVPLPEHGRGRVAEAPARLAPRD